MPHATGRFRLPHIHRLKLTALLLILGGCGDRREGPVVVGAIGPWERDFAQMTRLGMELAVAEINRDGGIGDRPLQLNFRNDSADGSRAVALANTFVAQPEVLAVIGPINSAPMVAAAEVLDGRLVSVSPTAASPELVGISPWVFRLITNDSVFGETLGRRAGSLGRRAAVLYDNNTFGRGGADAFRRNFPGALVSVDPIASGDSAVAPFVRYWMQSEVDLVFVAGLNTTGLAVLRERSRQGYPGTILGTDSWTPLVNQADVAEGVLIGTRFSTLERRREVIEFSREFRARYGRPPDGFAAYGYDAVKVVARALEDGGTSRAAVQRYLAALRSQGGIPGVTGTIAFTPSGDPVAGGFVLLRIRGGELTLVDSAGP
jgi:branched-chain amino acid transport system substrate-binding protein